MNNPQKWLRFFADEISPFYREMLMLPQWGKHPNYKTNPWDSLAIFLGGYAFERQGASANYAHAAVDIIESCRQVYVELTVEAGKYLWDEFKNALGNIRLNEKNCPLCYSFENSIIRTMLGEVNGEPNLTLHCIRGIEQGDVKPAHDFLTRIRGVGPKIAAFYLRDLVDVNDIDVKNYNNIHLLQPIDVWVRRVVQELGGPRSENTNDISMAKWIVENVGTETNPQRVNMGMWFFCAQVVRSDYRFKRVLHGDLEPEVMIQEYESRMGRI